MDFVEKNATVFAKLIQYFDYKVLSLVMKDAKDNGWKEGAILREHYLSKWKPKIISFYTELTSLRRLEAESITNYIIITGNICNSLKEAGGIISDGLLTAMVLKGLPPNFKLFATVITQKNKGVSSWCNGSSDGRQNRSKRVRTPVALLRSLSGKYPWERYEPPYPPSYGLNSTTTVLLGE